MDRADQLAVLSGASADQWGLVTAAQAKELGLNAVQLLRLTEAGLLESVSRGVYLLTVSGMPRHVEIKAAWLRLQPKEFAWDRTAGHRDSGVVSHASACQLHELGDIPVPEVELTVPRRRTTTEPFVHLRTAALETSDITVVDGLPVTTAARTVTDLLRAGADGGHIGGVIAEAAHRGLLDLDDLADRVEPHARKYGLGPLATGEELIDHLVGQAGAVLRRHEVARASKDGFEEALRLLAHHPDPAASVRLAQFELAHRRALAAGFTPALEQIAARTRQLMADIDASGTRKLLEDMQRHRQIGQSTLLKMRRDLDRLTQPGAAAAAAGLRDALRLMPDPASIPALKNLAALSPALLETARNTAVPTALPEPPAGPGGGQDGDHAAGRTGAEGSG